MPPYEGLNGAYRQPSNGQKINRQPSKTEYFYRQASNERAKISSQIFFLNIFFDFLKFFIEIFFKEFFKGIFQIFIIIIIFFNSLIFFNICSNFFKTIFLIFSNYFFQV